MTAGGSNEKKKKMNSCVGECFVALIRTKMVVNMNKEVFHLCRFEATSEYEIEE